MVELLAAEVLRTLFAVTAVFWGLIFLYLLWLDRRVASLKRAAEALEEEK